MRLLLFFFFLMIIFPTLYQIERGILLMILLLISVRKARQFSADKELSLIWITTFFTSSFFIAKGLILNTPGALNLSTVYIIWPLLYWYFIGICSHLEILNQLNKMIIIGGLVVLWLNIILLLNEGHLHISLLSELASSMGYFYGFYDGMIEFNSPTLTLAPYVFIFSLTLLLTKGYNVLHLNRVIVSGLIVLSAIVVFLSARRAFWIIILLAPFVVCVFLKIAKVTVNFLNILTKTVIVYCLLIGLSFYFVFDYNTIKDEFMSSFEFTERESNNERRLQLNALIEEWEKSPILGHGLGSYSTQCIRTADRPWEYELSYVSLLSQVGLGGVLIYLFSVLWVFKKAICLVRRNPQYACFIMPGIISLFGFLLINISNPYLLKFDYLWVLYLPIFSLNCLSKHSMRNMNFIIY